MFQHNFPLLMELCIRVFAVSIFIVFIFSGCSLTPLPHVTEEQKENKIERLNRLLLSMNGTIKSNEAIDFSKKVIRYSYQLAEKYRVVSPPLWHNTMVNLGIRRRGLCHEWSSDLLKYLLKQGYKSLQFYFVGANIGSYFEHNALSVSAKGDSLKNSILLDAWRDSGNLYFIEIEKDRSYSWKNREDVYRRYHHQ